MSSQLEQPTLPVDSDVADPSEAVATAPAVASSNVLRGLPFSAAEDDIRDFFKAFTVQTVFICKRNGRATGEAYVQVDSISSATKALNELNRQHMGHRYIEVFDSSEADMTTAKAMSIDRLKGYVVRARGLPYSASASDVLRFFAGLDVVRGMEGVVFTYTPDGRPTGELYVEFQDDESQKAAMKQHKETIGSRYIELFVSTKADMLQAIQHNRMILGYANRKRWLEQQPQPHGGSGGLGGHHGGMQQQQQQHMMYGIPPGGGGMRGVGGGGGGGGQRGARGGYGQPFVEDMSELFSGFNIGGGPQQQQRGAGGGGQMQYGQQQQQAHLLALHPNEMRAGGGRGGVGGRGGGGGGAVNRFAGMGGGIHDQSVRGHAGRPNGGSHHPQQHHQQQQQQHPQHHMQQQQMGGYSQVSLPQQQQHGHGSQMQQPQQQVGQAYLMQQQQQSQVQQSQQFDRSGSAGQYDPNMYLGSGIAVESNQQQQAAYFAAAAAAAAAAAGSSSRAYYAAGTGAAAGGAGGAGHVGQYYGPAGGSSYVSPAAAAAAYTMSAASRGLDYQHLASGALQGLELAQGGGSSGGLQRFEVTAAGELRGVTDASGADGGGQLDYSVAA